MHFLNGCICANQFLAQIDHTNDLFYGLLSQRVISDAQSGRGQSYVTVSDHPFLQCFKATLKIWLCTSNFVLELTTPLTCFQTKI